MPTKAEATVKPSRSPLPKKEHLSDEMNFFDALRKVQDGKCVTRQEWNDENIYVHMNGANLVIKLPDGLDHPLLVTDGDMSGEDWRVIVPHE